MLNFPKDAYLWLEFILKVVLVCNFFAMNKSTMLYRYFILLVTLILVSNPLTAASFNCKKASTQAERMICNDPDISVADTEMARAYKSLHAALPKSERDLLKADQRKWLKERKIEFRSCEEPYCHVFYLVRIAQLKPLEQVSFNCRKASSRSEKKICNSRLLKHADGRMAAVYKDLRNFAGGAYFDRQEQRDWLKRRDRNLQKQSCGTSCGWKLHKDRIEELTRRLLHDSL